MTRQAAELDSDNETQKRKSRFFFSEECDVTVFREITGEDGLFVDDGCTISERWQRVHTTLKLDGIDCTLQSLKNRVASKAKKYKADQAKSKRASESELDSLIREYLSGLDEINAAKAAKKTKEAQDIADGKRMREVAADRLVTADAIDGSQRRGAGPAALREYTYIRKDEIELKKRKMELELEDRRAEREERRQERRQAMELQRQSIDMQKSLFELIAHVIKK
ncbi:hypothetical protein P43SY_000866 [Pythium insidiosum]|uniref:Uncharacterized protein n=1 Tax=Pythium insidiosum TaxID=114742 RepID=A0AAD5M4J2_PYTIN|nr:hypothetical protein P43SY_000866 [Pythium insidiosum]